MASLNAGDMDRCLRRKLRATVLDDRRDRCFEVYDDDGNLVARTWLSHGWKGNTAVDASMLSKIKRQLGLGSLQDLALLVGCPLSRDQYLQRVS